MPFKRFEYRTLPWPHAGDHIQSTFQMYWEQFKALIARLIKPEIVVF